MLFTFFFQCSSFLSPPFFPLLSFSSLSFFSPLFILLSSLLKRHHSLCSSSHPIPSPLSALLATPLTLTHSHTHPKSRTRCTRGLAAERDDDRRESRRRRVQPLCGGSRASARGQGRRGAACEGGVRHRALARAPAAASAEGAEDPRRQDPQAPRREKVCGRALRPSLACPLHVPHTPSGGEPSSPPALAPLRLLTCALASHRRMRRLNERLAQTEVRKQLNRVAFGGAEEVDPITGQEFGMLGSKDAMGKLVYAGQDRGGGLFLSLFPSFLHSSLPCSLLTFFLTLFPPLSSSLSPRFVTPPIHTLRALNHPCFLILSVPFPLSHSRLSLPLHLPFSSASLSHPPSSSRVFTRLLACPSIPQPSACFSLLTSSSAHTGILKKSKQRAAQLLRGSTRAPQRQSITAGAATSLRLSTGQGIELVLPEDQKQRFTGGTESVYRVIDSPHTQHTRFPLIYSQREDAMTLVHTLFATAFIWILRHLKHHPSLQVFQRNIWVPKRCPQKAAFCR